MASTLRFLVGIIRSNWMLLLIVVAIVAAMRFGMNSNLGSLEDFEQRIQSGKPVVVEFFSPT